MRPIDGSHDRDADDIETQDSAADASPQLRGCEQHDADDTGIRSLLSGLSDPGLPSGHLTDRLRRSLSAQTDSPSETRQLPPVDAMPLARPRFSQRAFMCLVGATAGACLVGAVAMSFIRLPDSAVGEVLAATTLTRAGIPVTASGTSYHAETLTRQAGRLVTSQPDTALAVVGGTPPTRETFSAPVDEALERDVLACLRHLRLPARDVVAVDLADYDGSRAAVVVTRSSGLGEPVTHSVRIIDPACPALGNPVVAGPSVLPLHP